MRITEHQRAVQKRVRTMPTLSTRRNWTHHQLEGCTPSGQGTNVEAKEDQGKPCTSNKKGPTTWTKESLSIQHGTPYLVLPKNTVFIPHIPLVILFNYFYHFSSIIFQLINNQSPSNTVFKPIVSLFLYT